MGVKFVHLSSLLYPNRSQSSDAGNVRRGHFAVYVGKNRRRFVIPTSYLKHPRFQDLLRRAEEEFGFQYEKGGVTIPCDEVEFMNLASQLSSSRRE